MMDTPKTQKIAVLALDAADYTLLKKWDCQNILQDNHAPLESYAYTNENYPMTMDIWPSVATGRHARNLDATATPDWESPFLRAGSKVASVLPTDLRVRLGALFKDSSTEHNFLVVNCSHVFETGAVYGWPGVVETPDNLREAWTLSNDVVTGSVSEPDFEQRLVSNFGEELGWLEATASTNTPIAGVHSHILDAAGHAFGERPAELCRYYKRADEMVGRLKQNVDHLVILSDHGMQTSAVGDDDPGLHSWRSMVSTSWGTELPESVLDVRGWLEARMPEYHGQKPEMTLDTTEDQLKSLGYIQ